MAKQNRGLVNEPVETSTDEGTKGLKRREGYSNGNFLIWIESFLTGQSSKSDLII